MWHSKSKWITHVYVVSICIIVKRPELSYAMNYVYAFLQNTIVTAVEAIKF